MKVVHISSSDSGGAGIATQRLNNALCRAGVDSKLLCVHKSTNAKNVVQFKTPISRKILSHSGLPVGQNKYFKNLADYTTSYEAVSFPLALYDVSSSEIVKDADIINLHWVGNILNYPQFFSHINKPIVWTLHDMNPFLGIAHYMDDYNENIRFRRVEDEVARIKYEAISKHAHLTVVNLCKWMLRYSANSNVFKNRSHVIIPNSINIETFNVKDKTSARNLLGLPQDKKVLLFCAQSLKNKRKGFDLLLNALKHITHTCILAIIGYADDIALPETLPVRIFGTIQDELLMSIIYSASDAFILPSREDNLPNTMLESLCCGTPVISFSNGGMSEAIIHGKNGFLIDDIKEESLAKCINQYLSHEHTGLLDRVEISNEARKIFDPNRQASSYLSLYNNMLNC